MAERRKLIVVSHRGPVSYGRESGGRVARRGGGGLVTALRGLISHHDVTWIASAISDEDRIASAEPIEETARDGSQFRLRLVAHDESEYDWFYNVIANPILWFLQHYLWELAYTPAVDHAVRHAWEQGYVRVNQGFADAVLEELGAEPDAAVLFHDYHLYLAPRFVREAAPDAMLSHFVHIPWPQPDYWRILPADMRLAIHDGLLANDVVGFHANRWRLAFLRCAVDMLGAEGNFGLWTAEYLERRTRVVAAPISIDPEEFDELAASESVLEAEREIVERRTERLIVRVDRGALRLGHDGQSFRRRGAGRGPSRSARIAGRGAAGAPRGDSSLRARTRRRALACGAARRARPRVGAGSVGFAL